MIQYAVFCVHPSLSPYNCCVVPSCTNMPYYLLPLQEPQMGWGLGDETETSL